MTEQRAVREYVDGYRLVHALGHGGMADVFEAESPEGSRVAIKLLRTGRAEDRQAVLRFTSEISTLMRLSHPHIVRVVHAGSGVSGPYLVMELLSGRTLESELTERQKLSPEQTLRWMLPVLGAAATAHRAGILHRDLKPANIFLAEADGPERIPKLLDFGIAKVLEAQTLTNSGVVVGTPQYMSPEQVADQPVGPECDVWALGVILYRCLTGCLPFTAKTTAALMHKLVTERAPALRAVDSALPIRLAAAVDKALEPSPSARYASVEHLAQALLCTALADGIALPADPDPVGLPAWAQWMESAASGGTDPQLHPPISDPDERDARAVSRVPEDTLAEPALTRSSTARRWHRTALVAAGLAIPVAVLGWEVRRTGVGASQLDSTPSAGSPERRSAPTAAASQASRADVRAASSHPAPVAPSVWPPPVRATRTPASRVEPQITSHEKRMARARNGGAPTPKDTGAAPPRTRSAAADSARLARTPPRRLAGTASAEPSLGEQARPATPSPAAGSGISALPPPRADW